MHKELEKIRNRSKFILGDYPQKRTELANQLNAAQETLTKAKAQLDTAEDMESYDKAAEGVKRAEMGVKFANNALKKLDGAPRMSEQEYLTAVKTCQKIMNTATAEYRKKAADLMDQLEQAKKDYKQLGEDVNSTLIGLDEAANILQTKHPHKITTYTGGLVSKQPDRDAWKEYAVRYFPADLARLGTASNSEDGLKPRDSTLCAAWTAVDRGYPRKFF